MIDFSFVKEGQKIKFVGSSWAFGGEYKTFAAEGTYIDKNDCPEHEKGKLMIVEFMNNGTPMFFPLDRLNPADWEEVSSNA